MLNALHLHEESGEYRDWGLHTGDWQRWLPVCAVPQVRPCRFGEAPRSRPPTIILSTPSTEDVELRRPVQTLPDGRRVTAGDLQRVETGAPPSLQLVPQFGYISLFPLLMRLIPPGSPVLGRQLKLLRDERRLWTPYGLRSLRWRTDHVLACKRRHKAG